MTPAPKPELVPAEMVDEVWGRVKDFLALAVARQRRFSIEDFRLACRSGAMQLWVFPWQAAAVTQIQTFPLERICVIVLCGGEGLDGAEHWSQVIEEWAKTEWGAKASEIHGRKGWARALGYEVTKTVMRKEL